MEQNSMAWHLWRKKGIGASDSPVIMGVSPFKTVYQLWKEKLGPLKEEKRNFIFEKGYRLEAQARAEIEIELGYSLSPLLCEHHQASWLQASMDGININQQYAIECKVVGQAVFDAGICPAYYFPQIQHQYLVTGMKQIDLVMIAEIRNKNKKIIGFQKKFVEVPCDHFYIMTELLPRLMWFRYVHIIKKEAPVMVKKDAVKVKCKLAAKVIKELKNDYKKESKLRNELIIIRNDIEARHREIATYMNEEVVVIGRDMVKKVGDKAYIC